MNGKYILNDKGKPVPEPDILKWAAWFGDNINLRRVARDKIGRSTVSTVFLALDHRYGPGPPILWETLVMEGKLDREMDRCSGSREQAEAMHQRMVKRVKKTEGKP